MRWGCGTHGRAGARAGGWASVRTRGLASGCQERDQRVWPPRDLAHHFAIQGHVWAQQKNQTLYFSPFFSGTAAWRRWRRRLLGGWAMVLAQTPSRWRAALTATRGQVDHAGHLSRLLSPRRDAALHASVFSPLLPWPARRQLGVALSALGYTPHPQRGSTRVAVTLAGAPS